MANIKTYQIQINGIEQSISAVDALNKQLDALEKKIDALQGKAVNAASTSSGGASRTAELSDEDKLLKQIESTQSRINQADMADYKVLLDKKQELKELVTEQKSMTAEARLTEGAYANTMLGMKQHLADIKAAMQTVDLGDTDTFKKLTKDANELNQKLLEIEKSYGQFGRQVGHYEIVSEGIQGLKLEIGGISEEFENARQAYMKLKKEMQTLSVKKDMGIISEEEAERLKSLIPTVKQLESSIQDAGKPMDALMDSMQSIVALAQAGKGLAAFFGLEGTEIDETIKNLVALQNAMQGLQTIQKQMQAGDGLFKWLNKGNTAIDNFTNKLFGVKKATTEVTTATKEQAAATSQVTTASKAATTSAVAQTTATAGLTVGMKAATVAARVLGLALKAIGIGLITAGLAVTIEAVKDLAKSLFSESEAAKKAREEAEKLKQKIEEQRKSFIDASAQYHNAASRISHLRSEYMKTNDQLRKTSILKEASKEFKNLGISIKGVSDAETVLVKQGHDVIELLRLQGDAAAISAMRMEAYKNSFKILLEDGYDAYAASVIAGGSETVREYDKILDKLQDRTATLQENLKIDTKVFDENKKEIANYGKELINLRLKMMKDGLNKRLMQLDEEKRQTLNKLKNNQAAYLEAEKIYYQLRLNEIQNFLDEVQKNIENTAKNIEMTKLNLNVSELETQINEINKLMDFSSYNTTRVNTLVSSSDYKELTRGLSKERLKEAQDYINKYKEYSEEEKEIFEDKYRAELLVIRNYALYEQLSLSQSFEIRMEAQRQFQQRSLVELEKSIADRKKLLEDQALEEKKIADKTAEEKLKSDVENLGKQQDELLSALNKLEDTEVGKRAEMQEKVYQLWTQMVEHANNYQRQIAINQKKYGQQISGITLDTANEMSAINEEYFNTQIANFRDFNSKLSKEISKQPIYDNAGFGIINITATRKNFNEMLTAARDSFYDILQEKQKLEDDFKNGLIKPAAYNVALLQLNDLETTARENVKAIHQELKELGGDWWGSIDQWIQQVGQATNSIMSSLSEITSNQYEKQIDQQEKYIEEYEKLLDKQKEKTQEYADAVSQIENELSNARGDRRQQLVDALNAEMAAQRASLAQEKKIEKEKEKAERKKTELEYQQALAEKKMSVAQAALNAVMAVSMAAVNKWPIPAIPMMALAAAVGAAQVAAANSQYIPKPSYGDGGVIVGRSHKEGGVPVLGGRASVEGGEFITNKVTTAKNVGLLEYINSKRRKVDIADLLEFYNSGRPSKSIASVRTRFADGGVIPQLRTDISFNDRLITAFEDYSNRPQYVQVVDIIDQTERLNEVKVISGLEV